LNPDRGCDLNEDGHHIERAGGRYDYDTTLHDDADWQHQEALARRTVNETAQCRWNGDQGLGSEGGFGQLKLSRERLDEQVFGHEVHSHEQGAQAPTSAPLLVERRLELGLAHDLRAHQQLTQTNLRHGRNLRRVLRAEKSRYYSAEVVHTLLANRWWRSYSFYPPRASWNERHWLLGGRSHRV
jgi:hypothetical protein